MTAVIEDQDIARSFERKPLEVLCRQHRDVMLSDRLVTAVRECRDLIEAPYYVAGRVVDDKNSIGSALTYENVVL